MLKKLREQVYIANMELPKNSLVTLTWGNVSGIDRKKGLVVIKPSGVAYQYLSPNNMVIVDMDGNVVSGDGKPSSDTATHLALYKAFRDIGGVVHTHSAWATIFAQAGRDIPVYGTTHADYFYGAVPCTRALSNEEIQGNYELETGNVIIETAKDNIPAMLMKHHGPFVWGKCAKKAVENAIVLEEVAKMAYYTTHMSPELSGIPQVLLDKHYNRKHGENAYYGQ